MQSERSAVKRGVSMKSIYIAATLLIFSLLTGCSNPASDSLSDTIQENNQKISESAEENSEIKIVHSREDATQLLATKWEIKEPSALPDGYTKMDYYVYDKDMVEIRYNDDDNQNELYYRTSTRKGDISGNSHQYTEEKSISSENIDKIHVKGSGDLWMVAIWEEDDLSFSITFEKGLTQDELVSMIDSIK